jgi:hypothetical protein
MLRAKFLAQRGNSKGAMNTRSVTPSTSQRLNKLKTQQVDNTSFTDTSDVPSSKHTRNVKLTSLGCTVVSPETLERKCGNGKHQICNIVKDQDHLDQSEYITNFVANGCV